MVAGWRDHGHRRFFGGEKRGSMSRPNLWWSAELTAARLWRGWGVTRRSHRSRREVDFRFSTGLDFTPDSDSFDLLRFGIS